MSPQSIPHYWSLQQYQRRKFSHLFMAVSVSRAVHAGLICKQPQRIREQIHNISIWFACADSFLIVSSITMRPYLRSWSLLTYRHASYTKLEGRQACMQKTREKRKKNEKIILECMEALIFRKDFPFLWSLCNPRSSCISAALSTKSAGWHIGGFQSHGEVFAKQFV